MSYPFLVSLSTWKEIFAKAKRSTATYCNGSLNLSERERSTTYWVEAKIIQAIGSDMKEGVGA